MEAANSPARAATSNPRGNSATGNFLELFMNSHAHYYFCFSAARKTESNGLASRGVHEKRFCFPSSDLTGFRFRNLLLFVRILLMLTPTPSLHLPRRTRWNRFQKQFFVRERCGWLQSPRKLVPDLVVGQAVQKATVENVRDVEQEFYRSWSARQAEVSKIFQTSSIFESSILFPFNSFCSSTAPLTWSPFTSKFHS